MELAGRRVLVIGGAGTGSGGAISRDIAQKGGRVVVADLDVTRAAEVCDAIAAGGGSAVAIPIDVRDVESTESAIHSAIVAYGGLDGAVTVVGGYTLFAPWKRLHETSDEEWRRIYELNLGYVVRVIRPVLAQFLAQGEGGAIVSLGSISGRVSSPSASAYGAAKAGLANLAGSVAAEYARDGIRMNVVSCGVIVNETSRTVYRENNPLADRIPMGRPGEPAEVAALVSFLLSPAASYVSGQTIDIDGALRSRFMLPVPNTPSYVAG
jgi:3-oxoacyl-[acyl-carrier protein] reductase